MKDLKVIFMGTPDFAVPILDALIKNTNVILVVTQPDKLVGRKQVLTPPPIKKLALENSIDIFQPTNIKKDYQTILDKKPDIIITCAYGQLIPKELLLTPKLGCINVHASLLPKLRGGAPIHKALIDGYEKTGVTIMYMDEKMDNGDIISTSSCDIEDTDNVGILHDKLSIMGRDLLLDTLPSIINGTSKRMKQNDSEVTYAYNIKREEEHIDFNKSCTEIYNQVRGLNPWPLAYMIINENEMKVLECNYVLNKTNNTGVIVDIKKDAIGVSAKDGVIYITKIKPFGKKIMSVKDYLNGISKEDLVNKKVG